jgi:hypothetical protein
MKFAPSCHLKAPIILFVIFPAMIRVLHRNIVLDEVGMQQGKKAMKENHFQKFLNCEKLQGTIAGTAKEPHDRLSISLTQ